MNQFTRNILLWSVIAVAMVSLFGMFSDRNVPTGNSVAYSAFLTQVQNGEVSKVVIDDRNITVATQ
ncbi:MAG: ATP-dependent metallopeptidase FtsH/Yme1/Tma family protein, partial [Mailhella sp.]|nr:ATP-dependent metallopeptidase FtsH/Yme1/Tma family protein [Mailhella sp.]